MKKICKSVICAGLVALLGLPLQAQSPVSSYVLSTQEDAPLHVLSDQATTYTLSEGQDLSGLWLLDNTTLETAEHYANGGSFGMPITVPAKDGIEMPFSFVFGTDNVSEFGITGDGMVFFCAKEEQLYPCASGRGEWDQIDVYAFPDQAYNLIYWNITAYSHYDDFMGQYFFSPTTIKAGANSRIGYEYSATNDTLFIAFENIIVLDKDGNENLSASWQYTVPSSGNITFTIQSLQPQNDGYYGLYFGLQGRNDFNRLIGGDGSREVSDWDNIRADINSYPNHLNSTTHPEANEAYTLSIPPQCEAIADPQITNWDLRVGANSIGLGYGFECNATDILMILSDKETLTGDDLPEDGTTYLGENETIGSSLGVSHASVAYGASVFNPLAFEGLQTGVQYYLHAFLYNTNCSDGPIYSKPVSMAVHPSLPVPETLRLDSLSADYARLYIANSEEAGSYLLMRSQTAAPADFTLPDTTFTNNMLIDMGNGATMQVLDINGTDSIIEVENIGEGCYYYAWAQASTDNGSIYSDKPASISIVPPTTIPATFSFDDEEAYLLAEGWTASNTNLANQFNVQYEGTWTVTGVEVGTERFLYGVASSTSDIENGIFCIDAIAPAMLPMENSELVVRIGLRFYMVMAGNYNNYSLGSNDSVLVQYTQGEAGDRNWTTIAKITRETELTSGAFTTIESEPFQTSADGGNLYIRVAYFGRAITDAYSYYAGCAIDYLRVEDVRECKRPENISLSDENLTFHNATLNWEDGNNPSMGYLLRLQDEEGEWSNYYSTESLTYSFSNLESKTVYNAKISAVCAADTSYPAEFEFSTLQGLPYSNTLQNLGSAPEGMTTMIGELAQTGNSQLTDNGAGWDIYTDQGKNRFGIGNTTISANSWLIFPVINTADIQGEAELSFNLSAIRYKDGGRDLPDLPNDSILILKSEDGTFNQSHVIGSLRFSEIDSAMKRFRFSFPVSEMNHLALISPSTDTVIRENDYHAFWMDSLLIDWSDMACPTVTNLRATGRTRTSISLTWEGYAMEYAVVYMDRTLENPEYDTAWSENETYTLEGLNPGTSYAIRVIGFCGANRTNPGEASNEIYNSTQNICADPGTLSVVNVGWMDVRLACDVESEHNVMQIWAKDEATYPDIEFMYEFSTDTNDFNLSEETFHITYCARAISVCAPGDSSNWSNIVEFTTDSMPDCGTPTDLAATVDYENGSATLSWTLGENNENAMVFYRLVSDADFIAELSQTPNQHILPTIVLDSAYIWKIQGLCGGPLSSDTTEEVRFSTVQTGNTDRAFAEALQVQVYRNQIVVNNPSGVFIRSLEVYTPEGKKVSTYNVNTNDNVFVYTRTQQQVIIIRVIGEGNKQASFKALAW